MNLLAFLVPWGQTKTHGQYFIGKVEHFTGVDPETGQPKTSQFLIGKVEHFKPIDFGNGYQSNLVSQSLIGKVEQIGERCFSGRLVRSC